MHGYCIHNKYSHTTECMHPPIKTREELIQELEDWHRQWKNDHPELASLMNSETPKEYQMGCDGFRPYSTCACGEATIADPSLEDGWNCGKPYCHGWELPSIHS